MSSFKIIVVCKQNYSANYTEVYQYTKKKDTWNSFRTL